MTCQLRSETLRDFETTIEDVINTFRFTTPAVNQKFVEKSETGTSTCHCDLHSKS